MSVTLCALHPSSTTRQELLARCPSGVQVCSAATPADLSGVARTAILVVLLDPARTDPAHVVQVCPVRPVLVSISDLRVAAADVGVDAVLPLHRLTRHRLSRLVVEVVQRQSVREAS